MRIDKEITPETAVKEIGLRIAQKRLEQGITQVDVAKQAGVGKRTIERIEAGFDIKLTTLVRILRVLNLSNNLNELIPERIISPIDVLKNQKEQPKRATKRQNLINPKRTWKWGDEQ
jgi:transcriptional regulator with XRE-family HTH domain